MSDSTNMLRTPFTTDVPYAWSFNDTQEHKINYYGPHAQAIINFARMLNYKLELETLLNFRKYEVLEDIKEGLFNLSLHAIPYELTETSSKVAYTYPVEFVQNCVMVPLAPELPKWKYVVWPLGRYIWLSLFVGSFYIAVLMRYLHKPIDIRQAKRTRSTARNLLCAIAVLLYSPNMNLHVNNSPTAVIVFYTLLFALGFILSNYHISHMTAFCMKPIFVPRIDTWQQLIKSKMAIIIAETLYEELVISEMMDITPLESQLRPTAWSEFQQLLLYPPRTQSYVVPIQAWDFLNKQQRQLIQPYYHLTRVCFSGVHHAFPYQQNASYALAFDTYVMRIKQSGLWLRWQEVAFNVAVRQGYAHNFLDTYPVEPLNMEFFKIAWIVLAIGVPASCFAFSIELLVRRRRVWREYKVF